MTTPMSESEILGKFPDHPEMQNMFRSAIKAYAAWVIENGRPHRRPEVCRSDWPNTVNEILGQRDKGHNSAIDEYASAMRKLIEE